MRHADDDMIDTELSSTLDNLVQHRYQRVTALERETFLADITAMQVVLQSLCSRQVTQNIGTRDITVLRLPFTTRRFEPLLEPAALLGVVDVHVLGGKRPAIDIFHDPDDL